MRFLFSFFLIVFITAFSQAQTISRMDSILMEIEQVPVEGRMGAWKTCFRNAGKEDLPNLRPLLDRAFKNAEEIVGRDSAIIWKLYLQSYFVGKFQRYGKVKISTEILDDMKITADSLTATKGSTHYVLVEWYYRLGRFSYMQSDMEKADEYFKKALELNKGIKNGRTDFFIYRSIGLMKSYMEEFEEAKDAYSKADSLLSNAKISTADKYGFFYTKGYLHYEMGELEQAESYYRKVIDSLHFFGTAFQHRVQTDYGTTLCSLGKIDECVRYFEKLRPIVEKDSLNATMLNFSEEYSEALVLAGRNKEAKDWIVKTRIYYMNIQEARRNDEVQEWQTKYETKKKEGQIQLLEQEKTISQIRLVIISLIALFGIGILSFLIYRNKNKRNQLALQLDLDRQLAENRDRLFSSITHDIRTPLALMLAPLERAENNVVDKVTKSDIQLARRNGKRLMELFNQILDWNKVEARALKLNPQVGQLGFTFKSLCERYEQQAIEKGVIFNQKIKMPKGQFLLDYDKLDKIISNLVGNAIKFCEPGQEVTLRVDFEKMDSKYSLALGVSDQGPGIAADEQKELFERYVQGAQGKLKGGTGIGLALVKELVEMMKGDIELQSEIGKGATFKVNIPIEMIDEMSVSRLQNQGDSSLTHHATSNSDKALILVIEDEPELLEFLRSALSSDYDVEIANSTSTGLNIAINRIPEIIISDWTLPDHNGGWLCQQVAKNELTAHIPVMILTAHDNDTNQKEAFGSGAVAWMNKPFQMDTLKRQLKTILMQQQRAQKLWRSTAVPESVSDKKIEQAETVDPFMQKVIHVIEENYMDENFSVEKMAEALFLSRVQLFRKIKSITGSSASKMINELRLKKARTLLRESGKSVSEVTFLVGFADPSYFGKAYKQYFSVSPSQDLGNR
jgi:signal transduction histidine kinase/DNA-binding response OmpR family regulator